MHSIYSSTVLLQNAVVYDYNSSSLCVYAGDWGPSQCEPLRIFYTPWCGVHMPYTSHWDLRCIVVVVYILTFCQSFFAAFWKDTSPTERDKTACCSSIILMNGSSFSLFILSRRLEIEANYLWILLYTSIYGGTSQK